MDQINNLAITRWNDLPSDPQPSQIKKKKKYARKMPMEVKNEVRSMVTFYFYMLDSVYGINVVTTGFGKSRWWQP